MVRRTAFVSVLLCLIASSTLLAQGILPSPPVDNSDRAAVADRDDKAALAEEVVRNQESATGRAFDLAARNLFVKALQEKPLEVLQNMTFTPAPFNIGDTSADLVYTPVAPCRIIDTRLAGGSIGAGSTRNFVVAGNGTTAFTSQGGTSGGCGIPNGPATAVLINFVAVNPQGSGNLKGSAFPNAIPATGSILNYQTLSPTLNIANAVAFPICDPSVSTCSFDIILLANAAGTDVVADVLGYFRQFRKNQVESASTTVVAAPGSALPNGFPGTCTPYSAATITVNAPVAGKVRVSGNVQLIITHSAGAQTETDVFIGTAPTCAGTFGLDKNFDFVGPEPAGSYYRMVVVNNVFPVSAGTNTFLVSGYKFDIAGGPDSVSFFRAGLVATFEPN